MKIIILHGNDTIRSYERLTKFIDEAKKRSWEIVNDVIEETPSLFGIEKLIIIRDLKLIGKKEVKIIENTSGTLVIYSEKNIPVTFIKTLPKETKIEIFELPQKLWSFLDNFSVKTLHEVVKTEPIELVFSLLCSRIKDIYWAKVGSPSYPDWRIKKLKSQGSKYSNKDLKEIIEDLSIIDVKAKTSKTDLLSSLDMLLIKKLA